MLTTLDTLVVLGGIVPIWIGAGLAISPILCRIFGWK